ncbi:hypothetical protein [Bradyrhizobium sp. B117]|uniref:hypothetical protein n=1 Tax=Bradyrhizobium sp. B117 TaxID=3140246 RepID=UPI003182FA26
MLSLFVILLTFSTNSASAQMTCAKPSEQYATQIAGDVNATAQGLTRIFSAGVSGGARKEIVDLIGKYPNADRVLLQRDLISVTCELIKTSTEVDFDKKARLLIDITKEIQSAFAKASILLKPIKDAVLVLSSVPAPELEYFVAVVSDEVVYQRCAIKGGSVEYGDGVEFTTYYSYQPDMLKVVSLDANLSAFDSGNPILRIPRSLFFDPVDTARSGLMYFNQIQSGNCYFNDVEVHLAVWARQENRYLAIYKIRSLTSYSRCDLVVESESQDEFVDQYNRYAKFLDKRDWISRNYLLAAKSDAFSNVKKSQSLGPPSKSGSNTLSVSNVADVDYIRCADTDLTKVTKRRT